MQTEATETTEELTENAPPTKPGDAKKKVIIAVLLVILLAAILTQPENPSSGESSPAATTLKVNQTSHAIGSDSAHEIDAAARFSQTRKLSRMSIEVAQKSRALVAERRATGEIDARKLKVKAVYGTAKSQSAIIGRSIVRSRQTLPDGRQILSVSKDGVQLAR